MSQNGYPTELVEKTIKERLRIIQSNKNRKNNQNSNQEQDEERGTEVPVMRRETATLRYIEGLTPRIKNILNEHDIKTVETINNKLNYIVKTCKDKIEEGREINIVYKINCLNCPKVYIGQTKRQKKTRKSEHLNNIKKPEKEQNVISIHRIQENHTMDFDNIEVLHTERIKSKREIAEMLFIKKVKNNALNAQSDTEKFSPMYDPLLKHIRLKNKKNHAANQNPRMPAE